MTQAAASSTADTDQEPHVSSDEERSRAPLIHIFVNGRYELCLLDTGATIQVVGPQRAQSLGLERRDSQFTTVKGIGDNPLKVLGEAEMTLTFGHTRATVLALIVDHPLETVILSAEFCFDHGLHMSRDAITKQRAIVIGNETFTYDHQSRAFVCNTLSFKAFDATDDEQPDIVESFDDATPHYDSGAKATPVTNISAPLPVRAGEGTGPGPPPSSEPRVFAATATPTNQQDYDRPPPTEEIHLVGKPDDDLYQRLSPQAREKLHAVQRKLVQLSQLDLRSTGPPAARRMVIRLKDNAPDSIVEPQHILGRKNREVFREWCYDSLDSGLIELAPTDETARYTTNHCFPRQGEKIRVSITAIQLNKWTIKETMYSLSTQLMREQVPRADAMLKSVIDVRWAFNIIEIDEESRKYTTFYGPDGELYRYVRMPFGLTNAPAEFWSFIKTLFVGDEFTKFLKLYVDDLLVHTSDDVDKHVDALTRVVDTLEANNIPVRWQKVQLLRKTVEFVGILWNHDGTTQPNAESINNITNAAVPKDAKQLAHFVGVCQWISPYVASLSSYLAPLHHLMRKNVKWNWDEQAQLAFDKAKEACANYFKTSLMDWTTDEPLTIRRTMTDASDYGFGAALFQGDKLVALYSRSFNDTQIKWSTLKKEAYSIMMTLRNWKHLLWCTTFTLLTDHRPLIWLIHAVHSETTEAMLARWFVTLQSYDMIVVHCPGEQNDVADAMSRAPFVQQPLRHVYSATVSYLSHNDALESDTFYQAAWRAASDKTDPSTWSKDDPLRAHADELRPILSQLFIDPAGRLRLRHEGTLKIVVPSSSIPGLLRAFHDDDLAGHQGIERTLERLDERYYWPRMRHSVTEYVKTCTVCQKAKPGIRAYASMTPLKIVPVWQRITIDLLHPAADNPRGYTYLLAIRDAASRFAVLHPLYKKTASEVATQIFDVITTFGIPGQVLSDEGTEFCNATMLELSARLKYQVTFAAADAHRTVGSVERLNEDIRTQFRTRIDSNANWDLYLPTIAYSLNSAVSSATGRSPAEIFFGRRFLPSASATSTSPAFCTSY